MNELGPASRALLDAAREGMTPSAAAVKRMRANVAAASAASAAGGALAVKLTLVGVVTAGVLGAVITRGSQPIATAPEITVPQIAAPRIAVVQPERGVPAVMAADSKPHEVARAAPKTVESPERVRPVVDTSGPVDLMRENELVDQAEAALKRGDYGGAIATIKIHTAETKGHGQMAQEATAIAIEAMCRSHDPRATQLFEAFDRKFPSSAYSARLSASCEKRSGGR